jgi:tetratricopeptide (TPR) repeat protein
MPSPTRFQDLWDYADPAATEARFRGLLNEGVDGLDAELQVLTQIARALGLQRRFAEARALLDEVERRLPPEPDTAHIRRLLEAGRVANSSGDPAAARPHFLAAWELARELGVDGLAVDAAHMVAIVEEEAGALDWNERALALAGESTDPDARRWEASLLNNLGWTHHGAGRYEQALDCFERAAVLREEAGDRTSWFVARWAVARARRSLGRWEEALGEQLALQTDIAEAGAAEDGYVSEEIGELLLALGREGEARRHFAEAAALLGADEWFVAEEPQRLERLRRLGEEGSP